MNAKYEIEWRRKNRPAYMHTVCSRRLDIRRKMEVGNWTGRIYNMQGSPLNDARPVVLPDNLDGVLGRTLGKATMASNWYEWELEGEIGDGS